MNSSNRTAQGFRDLAPPRQGRWPMRNTSSPLRIWAQTKPPGTLRKRRAFRPLNGMSVTLMPASTVLRALKLKLALSTFW